MSEPPPPPRALSCPRCSAPLTVAFRQRAAVCDYCGTTLSVPPSREEIEYERIQIEKERDERRERARREIEERLEEERTYALIATGLRACAGWAPVLIATTIGRRPNLLRGGCLLFLAPAAGLASALALFLSGRL